MDQPTRGADSDGSLAAQPDPATDEMLLPELDDGVTLIDVEGGRGAQILQSVVLERTDATRSPDAVLDCLQDAIKRLHAGTAPVKQLVERNRVSKQLEGYVQNIQNVAMLKRVREQDLAVFLGLDIECILVDDEKSSRDQVVLAHEEIESDDASCYETQLARAVESVLSPIGWDRTEIRRELAETEVPKSEAFANSESN